jgi:hypothetical protein
MSITSGGMLSIGLRQAAASTTVTIYSSASDGYVDKDSAVSYATAWTATSATWVHYTGSYDGYMGQLPPGVSGGIWWIDRFFLYFDTSGIPPGAIIESASLNLYGKVDYSTQDFLMTVQNGQPTYPTDPMVLADYNKANYAGNGGSLTTAGFTTSGYNVITLNADGISWINKGGQTKLCIRSNRDIAGTEPTYGVDERVQVYTSEETGTSKDPYLSVTYTVPPWLSGWGYRKQVTVTNAIASYQTKILVGESSGASGEEVDCGGKCQADFDDLRFTGSDGTTLLDYWIESITGTTPNQLATVWVENGATPSTTCYMYYGKADATAVSNGDNTFIFFDDFPGSSLNTSKWTSGGTVSVSGGECTMGVGSGWNTITSNTVVGVNTRFYARSKSTIIVDYIGMLGVVKDGYNYHHIMNTAGANTRLWSYKDGANYQDRDSGVAKDTSYHIWQTCRNSNTNVLFYRDGSLRYTESTTVMTYDASIWLGAYNPGQLVADYCFIAKYQATEPTWGSWGSEVYNVEVSVSPTTYNFGSVAESSTYNTTTTYFTLTNASSIQTDQTINVTTSNWTGGVGWIHSDTCTPGVNTAGLKANRGGTWGTGDVIVPYSTSNYIYENCPASTNYTFGLKLYTPTEFTDGSVKTIIVRITAVAG